MAELPSNFQYDSATETLSWDACPGAIEYEISYENWDVGNFQVLYTGPNTECPFQVGAGDYGVKGKKKEDNPSGWSGPSKKEKVTVT